MGPKRLLLCTTGLGSGGAEALLVRFVAVAMHEGWRVNVISMMTENFHASTMLDMGAEVSAVPIGPNPSLPGSIAQARKIAAVFKPSVIQGWMYRGNFLASILARKHKTLPFWGVFCTPLGSNAPSAARIFHSLQTQMSKRTAAIVYNGMQAHVQHVASGFSDHRSIVFVNGVDLERYQPRPDLRAKVRQELGVADNDLVVLVAARVHPQKDWPTILEAARRSPGVTVVAAGAGTESLPELPNLRRLGVRKDMVALYNAADLFSLPSAFGEGTSVAMSEALACGTPGVVTDVGDNASAIGGAGVVVPISDPVRLVQTWNALDSNRTELHALKAKARTVAIERFDERKTFQPILAAYEKSKHPVKTAGMAD